MAQPLLDDALWALTGILFVLRGGLPWQMLPREMGCGSGSTCWRRLVKWERAGVWRRLHETLLAELRRRDGSTSAGRWWTAGRSARCAGAKKNWTEPTDRRKAGSKHHLVTDARGVPLVAHVRAANVNDITHLDALVADLPAVRGRRGRPRRRPDVLQGDRGYDSQPHRDRLAARGIVAIFGRRRTSHGSGLGVFRWVVERTLAWLHRFRRLAVRYERHDRVHHAFLTLGCALICWNYLKSTGRVF
jgi:transposase